MEKILGREITLVTEVKERPREGYAGNDYLHAPNQLAMAQYLRQFV